MSCIEMKNLCFCHPGGRCNEPPIAEADIVKEVKTKSGGEVLVGVTERDGCRFVTASVFASDFRELVRFSIGVANGKPIGLHVLLHDGTHVWCERLTPNRPTSEE